MTGGRRREHPPPFPHRQPDQRQHRTRRQAGIRTGIRKRARPGPGIGPTGRDGRNQPEPKEAGREADRRSRNRPGPGFGIRNLDCRGGVTAAAALSRLISVPTKLPPLAVVGASSPGRDGQPTRTGGDQPARQAQTNTPPAAGSPAIPGADRDQFLKPKAPLAAGIELGQIRGYTLAAPGGWYHQ